MSDTIPAKLIVEDPIEFHKMSLYNELSNFYPVNIMINGKLWLSTEHYYQAMKFKNKEYQKIIQISPTAYDAYLLGRQKYTNDKIVKIDNINKIIKKYKNIAKIDPKWDDKKYMIMYNGVIEKFIQNKKIMKVLNGTGDRKIIVISPKDKYWGQFNGVGKNMLGDILMRVRYKLME